MTDLDSALNQFCSFAQNLGYMPPTVIHDGRKHRFKLDSDKSGKISAEYCLHTDEPISGYIRDYKNDIFQTFTYKPDTPYTSEQREEHKRVVFKRNAEREAETIADLARASSEAQAIWDKAKSQSPPKDFPYLVAKNVKDYGLGFIDGKAVLPIYRDGKIAAVQYLNEDGDKKFPFESKLTGAYGMIGVITDPLYIVESYTTGATVHEATNCGVVVALACHSLPRIAEAVRRENPKAKIIIAADDDRQSKENNGMKYADKAAKAVDGVVVKPVFTGAAGTDFNDMAAESGLDAVKATLVEDDFDPLVLHVFDWEEMKPMPWLCKDLLARGMVHLIGGPGGVGKSQITIGLAAALSKVGGVWPDGSINKEAFSTRIYTTEDAVKIIGHPRLFAAGCDLDKVKFLHGTKDADGGVQPFNPHEDIPKLEKHLKLNPDVKLLILDPLMDFLKGESSKVEDVKRFMAPLVALAEKSDCAIVGIVHYNKGVPGQHQQNKISGSKGFSDTARITINVESVVDNLGNQRLALGVVKANASVERHAMYYHIEGVKFMNPSLKIEIESSRAVWGEEAHETMTKLEKPRPDASVQSKPKDEVIPSSKKAYDMIYNLLNYEDRTGDDLIDSLIRDGIGKTTASNARTRLKTEGLIIDYKLDGKYWWKLVSRHELECQDPTQDPTPKGVVKSLDPGSKDKTDDIHTVGHYIYNKVAKGHVLNYQDPGSNAHMTPQMLDPELDPGKSDRKVLKDGGSMTHDIRRAKLLKQYSPGLMGYSIKDIMSVTLDCELDRLSDPEMFELHVIEVAKLL